MAFLLDTSIAIDLRDEHGGTLDRVAALSRPYAFSLITVVELEGGVVANSVLRERRRQALDRLLVQTKVLAFDREVVAAYRQILEAVGFSRPRILDRLIAATAIVHDLTLVTINGTDFRDIPDLKFEIWSAAAQ